MDVFVSYSSSDKTIADAVVATLERAQIRCWYAPRDIRPGKPYAEAIVDGIRECRAVVVIVSSRSIDSQQVLREVERAIHYGHVIIPLRIEQVEMHGSFELFLSVSHWLDAITPPLEQHLLKLTDAVRSVLNPGTPAARPTPIRATTAAAQPAPDVPEITPDHWSKKRGGRIRQFFSGLLEDSDS